MMRRQHHGANNRVQPRGVTAPSRDGNPHRSRSTSQPPNGLEYFPRCRVPAGCLLGKHGGAVHRYLEQAARGLHQAHVGIGESTLQFGRQTGSPWLVISDNAVLDRNQHFVDLSRTKQNRRES
jgi:hypothetical protein